MWLDELKKFLINFPNLPKYQPASVGWGSVSSSAAPSASRRLCTDTCRVCQHRHATPARRYWHSFESLLLHLAVEVWWWPGFGSLVCHRKRKGWWWWLRKGGSVCSQPLGWSLSAGRGRMDDEAQLSPQSAFQSCIHSTGETYQSPQVPPKYTSMHVTCNSRKAHAFFKGVNREKVSTHIYLNVSCGHIFVCSARRCSTRLAGSLERVSNSHTSLAIRRL